MFFYLIDLNTIHNIAAFINTEFHVVEDGKEKRPGPICPFHKEEFIFTGLHLKA